VEQEQPTIPEHLSSHPFFSVIKVTRSLVLCICFVDPFCPLFLGHCVLCQLAIFKGPDQLFSFLLRNSCIDVHFMQINQEVCIKRSTIGTLKSVDCLLKHTFINHNKYVVDQTLEYFDVSFT
jgi:hypothetical protein